MRGEKGKRKKREQAKEDCWRDTNQDLEAVLLSPVIDERRSDKEEEERTQSEEGMKMEG